MEKGLMRIEANVSLDMGPKVELKNINSFKAVGAAIAYELKRQEEIIGKGEAVEQETRGWDDAGQRTVSQRSKEEAHDYRYFPEPDLPPFEPPKVFDLEDLERHLPELPAQKRARFQKELRLSEAQAAQLVESKPLADFFEAAASELATRDEHTASILKKAPQDLLFSYLTSDLAGLMNEAGIGWGECKVNPEELAHLVDLIADGKIGSRQAKDILKKMFETGEDPETVMREENLETVSDSGALAAAVEAMIAAHPEAVADYRKGKAQSIQFLIGKAMGHLRGRGNPDALMKLFLEKLAEDRRH
jgi:aspartyl-tRNA(Asn)/glutamyl-tRNA(Gln) amidotransferase subunit B